MTMNAHLVKQCLLALAAVALALPAIADAKEIKRAELTIVGGKIVHDAGVLRTKERHDD